MAFNTIANFLSDNCNFLPLSKTWYELQVDTILYRTYRFAKRSDHTGVLIKLDMDEIYKVQTLAKEP